LQNQGLLRVAFLGGSGSRRPEAQRREVSSVAKKPLKKEERKKDVKKEKKEI
jgi:hypothetical protein